MIGVGMRAVALIVSGIGVGACSFDLFHATNLPIVIDAAAYTRVGRVSRWARR
jgi:hypothetical protein